MSKLKLTYFDFHGGRGEPARLALSIGEIPFEDDRVPPAEWEGRKAQTLFGALPVLERDGHRVLECRRTATSGHRAREHRKPCASA
jgi:prostaglandin-H2 D-isomerase / glutathione transferase